MDSSQLAQNVVNLLNIHLEQTGHAGMELAEIASHLRVPVEDVKMAVLSLEESGMVETGADDATVRLLKSAS